MSQNDNREGLPNAQSAPPDLSGLLSSVLSNPAAMSMLSSLVSGMKNVGSDAPPSPPPPPPQAVIPTLAPLSNGARRDDRRSELLCALKPFVSRSRCEMIDRLIGILALAELAAPLLGGESGKKNTYYK